MTETQEKAREEGRRMAWAKICGDGGEFYAAHGEDETVAYLFAEHRRQLREQYEIGLAEGKANPHSRGTCDTCDGCGKVADTDDQELWTLWLEVTAAFLGLRPITCPACNGTGRKGR